MDNQIFDEATIYVLILEDTGISCKATHALSWSPHSGKRQIQIYTCRLL